MQIVAAEVGDRGVLANLMQFYIHDFSEQFSGTARGDLENDGRFEDYPLDAYWQDPSHVPLLLKLDGRLGGFALLNATSHSGRPVDRNMAEFYVVRKHRRSGLGTAAAQAIFNRYPGIWEVAVARRNVAALAFWKVAITTHTQAVDVQERDLETATWNGPIFNFEIR